MKYFHKDNMFLVESFEEETKNICEAIIDQNKLEGSYYDFHIITDDHVIVPKKINFTLKYFHLIKNYSPTYFNNLMESWKNVIPKNLYNILQYKEDIDKVITQFDNIILNDEFDILPNMSTNDNLLYYDLIDGDAVKFNIITAYKFKKLYAKLQEQFIYINSERIYIFPVNDIAFYTLVDNNLKLKYPKWNSFRWSTQMPKYIICDGEKIYFEKDKSDQEVMYKVNSL